MQMFGMQANETDTFVVTSAPDRKGLAGRFVFLFGDDKQLNPHSLESVGQHNSSET